MKCIILIGNENETLNDTHTLLYNTNQTLTLL